MLNRLHLVNQAARSRAELVDDLMDRYVEWREQSVAVRRTYEEWSKAPAAQQRRAFEDFEAALDLEEQATLLYADRVSKLERDLALALVQERKAA
jgi:hypothetical protein